MVINLKRNWTNKQYFKDSVFVYHGTGVCLFENMPHRHYQNWRQTPSLSTRSAVLHARCTIALACTLHR